MKASVLRTAALKMCYRYGCLTKPDMTIFSTSGVPRVISGDREEHRHWLTCFDCIVGLQSSVEVNQLSNCEPAEVPTDCPSSCQLLYLQCIQEVDKVGNLTHDYTISYLLA